MLIARTRRKLRKPKPKVVSRKAIALAIGVDARTVARWLKDEDCPSLSSQEALRRWLDEVPCV